MTQPCPINPTRCHRKGKALLELLRSDADFWVCHEGHVQQPYNLYRDRSELKGTPGKLKDFGLSSFGP